MAYRLTYQVNCDWWGPGTNVMNGASWPGAMTATGTSAVGPGPGIGMSSAGGAQRKVFFNGTSGGQNVNPSSPLAATDIALMLTGVSSAPTGGLALDIYNQMISTNNLAQLQGFASGGG